MDRDSFTSEFKPIIKESMRLVTPQNMTFYAFDDNALYLRAENPDLALIKKDYGHVNLEPVNVSKAVNSLLQSLQQEKKFILPVFDEKDCNPQVKEVLKQLLDVMKNVTVFLSDQQSLFNSAINGSKSSNLTYSVSCQLAPA